MKSLILLAGVIGLAPLPPERHEAKDVVVDPDQFSAIYPAVWFSPSTGEVSGLKKKSEVPHEEKYEIWIEPRDPEFAFGPVNRGKGVGFALLGKGAKVFRKAVRPRDPKLQPNLTKLMKEGKAGEQPVFYCKGKHSECVLMITAVDSGKQIIRFKWKLLSREKE
jgi:hypothetical protein